MFIRRLDVCAFVVDSSLGKDFNKVVDTDYSDIETTVDPERFRKLVLYAWSLKEESITWDEGSESECLRLSDELTDMYGYAVDIPLVNKQTVSHKLARLSVSTAIIDRSYSDNMILIVKKSHVKSAFSVLTSMYSSSACALDSVSDVSKSREFLGDDEMNELVSKFDEQLLYDGDKFMQFVLILIKGNQVKVRSACEATGYIDKDLLSIVRMMKTHDLIYHDRYGYHLSLIHI